MLLNGFGITNYRSIGDELCYLCPLKKVNIVIGQNNSGKSNILRLVNEHLCGILQAIDSRSQYQFQGVDRHIGGNASKIVFSATFKKEDIHSGWFDNEKSYEYACEILNTYLTNPNDSNYFDIYFDISPGFGFEYAKNAILNSENKNDHLWQYVSQYHFKKRRFNQEETIEDLMLMLYTNLKKDKPKIETKIIEANRKIGTPDSDLKTKVNGDGIIKTLAMLQNPDINNQNDKKRFAAINKFLHDVTGNNSIHLNIPHNAKDILVDSDGKTLPLSSLGTGIHEVVILAAAATAITKNIVCIEEPEIHLHPSLQRRLVKYLSENTDNQYIISTHSAHIIDSSGAAIFHVKNDTAATKIALVQSNNEKFNICCDIGFKASDIMQSNCIIWVEGPTERIYLKHWINALPCNLIEGIHYSIMFYGGRLLSHLSADDNIVNDFIALRKLNQNSCIIIDSDYTNDNHNLNSTKKRLRKEFNNQSGFAWITTGREIENYIPPDIISDSLKEIYNNMKKLVSFGQYDKIYYYINSRGKTVTEPNKVRLAHTVTKRPAVLDVLDLRSQIMRVIEFIKNANKA